MKYKNNLRMNGNRLKSKGFTLIELLVVIAIIGLLASVILASLKSAKDKTYDAQIKSDMNQVRNALELYAGANNYAYPPMAMIENRSVAKSATTNEVSHTIPTTLIQNIFAKPAYAQTRNRNCQYYDNLESALVPTYIGQMPRHPLDDGGTTCYKYFTVDVGGTVVATVYGSLVTERFSNGINKQVGVVLGKNDIESLKSICSANRDVAGTPFPLFAAPGGGDVCNADEIVDMVTGLTNGTGDLSSDTYI